MQIISLGNAFQAAMIVAFAMLAATTAPIHEEDVGVATYHVRCILIIVVLIPGLIATRTLNYKAFKGKNSEGWALASTVLVLYAAGLCYAMFMLSYNSVVFGPTMGQYPLPSTVVHTVVALSCSIDVQFPILYTIKVSDTPPGLFPC